jgi:hypothetical protein
MKLLGETQEIDVAYKFGPTYFGILFEKWFSDYWKPDYMSRTQTTLNKGIMYANRYKYEGNYEDARINNENLIFQIRNETNTAHTNLTNCPGYFQRIIDSIKAFGEGGFDESIVSFAEKIIKATAELFGFGGWKNPLTKSLNAFDYLMDLPSTIDSGANIAFGINSSSNLSAIEHGSKILDKKYNLFYIEKQTSGFSEYFNNY